MTADKLERRAKRLIACTQNKKTKMRNGSAIVCLHFVAGFEVRRTADQRWSLALPYTLYTNPN